MDIQELIIYIEEEFEEVDKGTLLPESSIRDIEGWSSMHALILIALVDNHYDILLTGEELKNALTIQDLFNAILKRKS
jgi:acyl carrier protein